VLLRVPLFLPHAVVLAVWSVFAAAAALVAWLAALASGRVPARLHHFLASFLRHSAQVAAWLFVLSDRYPHPLRMQSHPFAVTVPEAQRQSRLTVLLRPLLALPALVLASALGVVLTLTAVAAWIAGVALGRTTAGLQELGAFCLLHEAETAGYVLLLTPGYPRLTPE